MFFDRMVARRALCAPCIREVVHRIVAAAAGGESGIACLLQMLEVGWWAFA
ncbi:hypothetical protein CCHOA_00295 [Corynebacterium choanae]|uniref:Uncharacterized protein n=1 Tax=Corynebacterium choanae TaxID=1862358 RepID=A0A3G6J345_9CORY|nr:hypothetical protein CCHOA_00295 [Corynebacterium choanae]